MMVLGASLCDRAGGLRPQPLCVFAVPALIACAGCSPPSDPKSTRESSPVTYQTVGMLAEQDDAVGAKARAALADGFLSQAEYDEIWAAREDAKKAEVIDLWMRRDSDTRRMAETGTGSVRSTGSAVAKPIAQRNQ